MLLHKGARQPILGRTAQRRFKIEWSSRIDRIGLEVKGLELYTQFIGKRFIRGLYKDRSIFKHDSRNTAHASIGSQNELFGLFVIVDIDKIIRNMILIQIASCPATVSAPIGSVYCNRDGCHADAPS